MTLKRFWFSCYLSLIFGMSIEFERLSMRGVNSRLVAYNTRSSDERDNLYF